MKKTNIFPKILTIAFIFSACAAPQLPSPNPAIQLTSNLDNQKTLTICLGEEPESLYAYLDDSQAAREILQAIYDGPIDFSDGKPYPVILDKIPSFSDGNAYLTTIEVNNGDLVINTIGDPVLLQAGVNVFPSGCSNTDCAISWDGANPLEMDYLTTTYHIKPGITWSDGHPLTAHDSVYSYNVASDPATPINKLLLEQTASYTAINEQAVQWISKPGLVTDEFEKYFWTPLPEHAWRKYSASELLTSAEANQSPLGWGAYKVEDWVAGKSIHLTKNPYYFRAEEGIPYFDNLIFKFIGPYGDTALSNLKFDRAPFQQFNYDLGVFENEIIENGCDLTTTTSNLRDQLPVLNILLNYFKDPAVKVIKGAANYSELIVFNLREDDSNTYLPQLDLIVRNAINLCLNREKAINELSFGLYENTNVIRFTKSKSGTQKNESSIYDLAAGSALLDHVGWKDLDNSAETPRLSSGIPNIPDGKELSFIYLVEDIEDNLKSSEIVKATLAECGIGINIKALPSEIFWDASHKDSIFHRNYDLAQLTWASPMTNPCQLFSSNFIPG